MAGERCEECGFVWDDVSRENLPGLIRETCAALGREIKERHQHWGVRPSPERWSSQEYAGHVRDVLLSVRERVVLAAVLDKPTGTAIYRDDRVRIGLYAADTVEEVAADLATVGDLLARTVRSLPAGFEDRTMVYSAQTPLDVTVMWVAAQGLHEAVHHLGDIRENGRLIAGR